MTANSHDTAISPEIMRVWAAANTCFPEDSEFQDAIRAIEAVATDAIWKAAMKEAAESLPCAVMARTSKQAQLIIEGITLSRDAILAKMEGGRK